MAGASLLRETQRLSPSPMTLPEALFQAQSEAGRWLGMSSLSTMMKGAACDAQPPYYAVSLPDELKRPTFSIGVIAVIEALTLKGTFHTDTTAQWIVKFHVRVHFQPPTKSAVSHSIF
jgi:hypothetical protein